MEKASLFKGYRKYIAGAGLLAVLNVGRIFADGMPEEHTAASSHDTDQNSPQITTTKEMNAQVNRIEDKLDRLIRQLETKAQPKKIDCILEELKAPEKLTREECNDKKIDMIHSAIAQLKQSDDDRWPPIVDKMVAALSMFLSLYALYQSWRYFRSQEKDGKKLQSTAERQERTASRAEENTYKDLQNTETLTSTIQVYATLYALEQNKKAKQDNKSGQGIERAEEIGPFPERYPYINSRIRSAKTKVIITIPFFQFGVVASPHGLYDFHHTLHDRFGKSAAAGEQLVILTYEKQDRCDMARRRYNPALSALEMVNNKPQTKKLLSVYSHAANKIVGLETQIGDLADFLDSDEANYDRLKKMEKEQKAWLEREDTKRQIAACSRGYERGVRSDIPVSDIEISDELFLEFLQASGSHRQKDATLFEDMHKVRTAIDEAAQFQENMYLSSAWDRKSGGTPWPQYAKIITVPRNPAGGVDFDNKMTIYINDKGDEEVIHAFSSLKVNDDSRDNKVTSGIGEENLELYKNTFLELLRLGGKHNDVAEYRKLWGKLGPEYSPII